MAIGSQFVIKVREVDASTLVLERLTIKDINHDAAFTAPTTSVVKEDFPDTDFDTFIVKIGYPSGSSPASSTTIAVLLQTASAAIRAKYGAAEVVSL
jgi:hypothetical protein